MQATTEKAPSTSDVIRQHLGPLVSIVNTLDNPEDMDLGMVRAVATLAEKARAAIAAHDLATPGDGTHNECWEAEALCTGLALLAYAGTEHGFERTCFIDGPEPDAYFIHVQVVGRMMRERWLEEEAPTR